MRSYRTLVNVCLLVILVFLAMNQTYNPFTGQSLEADFFMQASKMESGLYKEIEAKRDDYAIKAEDAVIDRVWKKTPGLNGLQVNVDKSYQKMKKKGEFQEDLLVFDQITPDVTLKDLPAAPIYRGHPKKQMVALLINVSWGTEYIPSILRTLKEKNVKATFFIEGKWAKENASYVQMMEEEGHVIGSHAYNHPDMARISNQAALDQLTQTNNILKAITGKQPVYFAPPSGSYTDHVVELAHQLKMETILWTVDTIDWKKPSVSVMINRVMSKLHPGATILMHPTAAIEKGLPQLIDDISDKGYRLGTIQQLLSEER
ncbi:polysaccharide deacetylase family protein [Ornithinibacillus gellani]|uniref:polysaccharide deacetylase family protein n=1 Tax=Ornithinibacillus gellani TaxID=2293253 RepID=UPI000F47DB22|nr:polysaccharide deacetylase family protein [Ornithinibacillus gellani]TQS75512.1 polysaccharide deacetylase family protein [Ornithinibacillus gellani]